MRKVIIIGATSGIGKGLAELYAAKGWSVGITGRRGHLLQEIQQSFPQQVITFCFDITAADNLQHIDELVQRLGGLDLFIYCSGIGEISVQPDWEIDEKVIATNVTACAKAVGHIFNYFVQLGRGQVAIISSIAALRGGSSAPSYNASKAFVSSYAESLNLQAISLGKDIVITDVKPGFVDTSMAKGGGKFWMMPVGKICMQIASAIEAKKRKVVVSKRWRLVAFLMKNLPDTIFIYITKRMAAKRQQL
ncbi:SDR family NAD(P)-dependent oxidoreductase [Aridibaculum aurantiacum]|uniref:SDR family NAD(P)-dependent oxidoreductase n=1 Tax=Aridibaculum aurantiacum TaxID=2810307 RepID=UPI001A95EAC3|nr:SDR family NAD(P)-dependent oxidoreductase [Aridibaculum aurantiacum]